MISIEELTKRGYTAYLRGNTKTPFILYTGLIILAHEKGLQRIETEMVQCDWDAGRYVFKATVVGKDGETFVEYGDATKQNVGRNIEPHAMRMAATRAKARALRDFTGLGLCTKEELEADESDWELVPAGDQAEPQPKAKKEQNKKAPSKPAQEKAPPKEAESKQSNKTVLERILHCQRTEGTNDWEDGFLNTINERIQKWNNTLTNSQLSTLKKIETKLSKMQN
tara:strand:- start:855 stop:1529 length:675 start_codon:yes stop_codon:yes gene_type:complete